MILKERRAWPTKLLWGWQVQYKGCERLNWRGPIGVVTWHILIICVFKRLLLFFNAVGDKKLLGENSESWKWMQGKKIHFMKVYQKWKESIWLVLTIFFAFWTIWRSALLGVRAWKNLNLKAMRGRWFTPSIWFVGMDEFNISRQTRGRVLLSGGEWCGTKLYLFIY